MDVNAVIASAFKGAGLVQASPVKAPKAPRFSNGDAESATAFVENFNDIIEKWHRNYNDANSNRHTGTSASSSSSS